MATSYLDSINSPQDLKKLNLEQLENVAEEIRHHIIEITGENGGHLGSNLGVVELTIALHYVFDSPNDKFIFDVGHQGYIHKILTGRKDLLKTLRQTDGCCGFLDTDESVHDVYGAGHAGTALSAGLGMAVARDQKGSKEKIISIVGDGGLGCGISLEALNNIADTTDDFIVILNDNKMSISPNVGSLSKYLNRLITDKTYNSIRSFVRDSLEKIPHFGTQIKDSARRFQDAIKSLIVPGIIFEELGLRYVGPIDGHNIKELIDLFSKIKDLKQAVVIHTLTQKGHGFESANDHPEKLHGFKKANNSTNEDISFSQVFGNKLCKMASADKRIIAISAGMISGTGMTDFQKKFPDRTYDVGIAEEHGTIFASGLAKNKLRPVVAIYSTFMQRAMDCVYHDICIQNIPVMFCMDRSGIVEDGPTHHGIVDLSFWLTLPNLTIMQPCDQEELEQMMDFGLQLNNPSMIRYPKDNANNLEIEHPPMELGKACIIKQGDDISLWACGREVKKALEIAHLLQQEKISVEIINPRFLAPFDKKLLISKAIQKPIISLENHYIDGGLASLISQILINEQHKGFLPKGYPKEIITWGNTKDLEKTFRLSAELIAQDIKNFLQTK